MTTNQDDPLGEAVRLLLRPKPPTPTATPRVAVLNPGDGTLSQLIRRCGLDVVHERSATDLRVDFGKVPVYDLVAANIPDDPKERADVLELTARFLYGRRPLSFLFVSERLIGPDFLRATHEKLWRMGYKFIGGDARTGAWGETGRDSCTYLVGSLDGLPSLWSSGLAPEQDKSGKESSEGQDEPLNKYLNIMTWQEINEPPTLTLGDIVKSVARYGRED